MRVLAGDVGGTKTVVAIAEVGAASLLRRRTRVYPSAGWRGLEEIVEDFVGADRNFAAAAFGVAGPVVAGRARVTKLPWTLDERRLTRRLDLPAVRVLNDFVAAAVGLPRLAKEQLVPLVPGVAEAGGPVGLIGAGTGLGQAAVIEVAGVRVPIASEGGHVDFGPRNDVEDRLVRFVRARAGRVSRDRLLSGEGLSDMYEFVRSESGGRASPSLTRALGKGDRAAAISRFALSGKDRDCARALRLFVSIYGSEAGNLAIQYRATGGVYVAGGIAPRILPALSGRAFRDAFRAKPPLEALLAKIPVFAVLDTKLPLLGAAEIAYRTAIENTRPRSKTITRSTPR